MPKDKERKRLDQWKFVNTTPDHYKSMSWCIQNDIKVYPKKTKEGFKLICVRNGQAFQSGISYNDIEIHQKIWDFYAYLHKKYNKCIKR